VFSRSGRFNVIVATGPSAEYRIVSYEVGSLIARSFA
jgi:hypothetical protein